MYQVPYFIIRTSLSNLPGLRRAGSRLSGRLVAPTMRKRSDWLIPSISVRSWATRRSSGADEPVLLGHRESSSSKNSTQGPSSAADRARSNTARNFSSLSPGRDPTTWNNHSQITMTINVKENTIIFNCMYTETWMKWKYVTKSKH